jgi:hypothetical protein
MLTPSEFALIVDCTQLAPNTESIASIRAKLLEGVNWHTLLQFAIPHGVLPLIVNTLTLHAADLISDGILSNLQRVLTKAEARNRSQWRALAEAMQALETDGVRVLAYKGPALTALVYGDFRLRESHDLDLWADPHRTARTAEVLIALGYRAAVYEAYQPRPVTNHATKHTEFLSADDEVVIDLLDLQLRPQFFFCPDYDAIFNRRQHVTAFEATLPTLGIEDLLLALVAHGSKHLWRRLNWISDLAALLAGTPALDWDAVIERSKQWRCHRRLLSAMALVEQLYGSQLPPAVVHEINRQREARISAGKAVERLLRPTETRTLKRDFSTLAHHLRETDMLWDRLTLVRTKLRARAKRLPSTISKRTKLQKRNVGLGSWRFDLPVVSITLKVDLNTKPDQS